MMASPIINQYLSIKNQYKDYLLFFRLGDFYELFYDDAKIAAKVLNITLTKKTQKDEDIPMSGIPFHTCDHYIAKLVQNGYKIAICEQTDTIDSENKIINREVVRIITNGTATDDILLEPKRNNYLLAISGDGITISTAIFDLSTNEFIVEDIPKSHLKLFLEKTDAQEILLSQNWISNFSDYNLYNDKITIIQETPIFHIDNKIKTFFNLHSNENLNSFSIDNKRTIITIIEYLEYTQKSKLRIHFPIKKAKEDELILDKFTRRNLEITKTLQNQTKGSLIWLLDETKTSQGARLLFKFLNNPINSIETLNNRYNKIEYFMNKKEILEDIQIRLIEIPDFERLLSKIILKRTNPFELRQLSIGIINIINIAKILEKEIPNHTLLATEILKAIKEDTSPNNYKDTDYINHGYDQQLTELKDFNQNIESKINKLEEEYKNYTKISNLRIKNTPLGFLIEINNTNIPKLDYKFSLKQSLKTTSRFCTEKLYEINENFNKCSLLIKEKENEIFINFLNKIEEISEDIYYYSSFSSDIDVFSNLAVLSLKYNYIRPIITNDNSFEIKHGVHPILQKVFNKKGNNLVENDCNLNNQPIMFLTGPNMAGKSTYLRQQALICLIAHCGFFVPASYAKIGLVDQIFSRISTNDNLLEGNSTFMMEMIELSLTITQATNKSFLILDEIGRGTSAQEGKALAQAILEYLLNNLKCRSLFSSHYLEIAQLNHDYLDKKMMQINNNSDNNQIHFTYKITNGVSKKSYALEVAKMTGMPLEIIQTAEKLLNS